MKKLIMFSMVIAIAVPLFSGIASAQPVCFTICPTNAGPGDLVTMTGYDEEGEFFDLSTLDIFESNFHGIGDPYYTLLKDGDELTNIEIIDGTVVFELIEDMLSEDVERWDFFCVPGGDDAAFRIANSEDPEDAPFETVAEAIEAGGTCGDLDPGCDTAAPAITVDSNDIYEPQDAGGPPAEGNQRDLLWVSLAWQPGEPTYPAFTAYVKVDPNEGDAPHEDFTFINPPPDPNGNVHLTYDETNWDVPQYVVVEAVADIDREGDESYPIELTVTIDIADPNFGNPTPVVVESGVTVIDNDIPFVSVIPDEVEISESDPCTCVDLAIRLSHKPTHDVYVRLYTAEWAFEEDMAYLDPSLDPEGPDPNKLTFTVTDDEAWVPGTMTSGWNVEQTVKVCPIDNDELAEAWEEWIGGDIWIPVFSEDVRYLVPWHNPDGSDADDPCTPEEEETSDGEADEAHVGINVQDNECGAVGFARQDYNEDCTVGLGDFVHYYAQWLICTEPYTGDCDKYWVLVEE